MSVGDALPALMVVTLAEAYLLHRTVFTEETFRLVGLGTLAVNLVLKGLWSLLVWPLVLNPLRHLPTVPVCPRESPQDQEPSAEFVHRA